jgi:hypothetical protein
MFSTYLWAEVYSTTDDTGRGERLSKYTGRQNRRRTPKKKLLPATTTANPVLPHHHPPSPPPRPFPASSSPVGRSSSSKLAVRPLHPVFRHDAMGEQILELDASRKLEAIRLLREIRPLRLRGLPPLRRRQRFEPPLVRLLSFAFVYEVTAIAVLDHPFHLGELISVPCDGA